MLAASKEHCFECFRALDASLRGGGGADAPPRFAPEAQTALFVTWTLTRGDKLRGCIGNLSSVALAKGLVEYALRAARDSRFEPIALGELPKLSCGVSLLGDFEPAARFDDWVVGTHGVVLKLEFAGRSYSATYLPEVAEEQGWNQRAACLSLLCKAGLDRADAKDALLPHCRVTRYKSSKATATYDEYRASGWAA